MSLLSALRCWSTPNGGGCFRKSKKDKYSIPQSMPSGFNMNLMQFADLGTITSIRVIGPSLTPSSSTESFLSLLSDDSIELIVPEEHTVNTGDASPLDESTDQCERSTIIASESKQHASSVQEGKAASQEQVLPEKVANKKAKKKAKKQAKLEAKRLKEAEKKAKEQEKEQAKVEAERLKDAIKKAAERQASAEKTEARYQSLAKNVVNDAIKKAQRQVRDQAKLEAKRLKEAEKKAKEQEKEQARVEAERLKEAEQLVKDAIKKAAERQASAEKTEAKYQSLAKNVVKDAIKKAQRQVKDQAKLEAKRLKEAEKKAKEQAEKDAPQATKKAERKAKKQAKREAKRQAAAEKDAAEEDAKRQALAENMEKAAYKKAELKAQLEARIEAICQASLEQAAANDLYKYKKAALKSAIKSLKEASKKQRKAGNGRSTEEKKEIAAAEAELKLLVKEQKKAKSDAKHQAKKEKKEKAKLEKEKFERRAMEEEHPLVSHAIDAQKYAEFRKMRAERVAKDAMCRVDEATRVSKLAHMSQIDAESRLAKAAGEAYTAEGRYYMALDEAERYKKEVDDYPQEMAEKAHYKAQLQKMADVVRSNAIEEVRNQIARAKAELATETQRANEAVKREEAARTKASALKSLLMERNGGLRRTAYNPSKAQPCQQEEQDKVIVMDNRREFDSHVISDDTSDDGIEEIFV